jgi:hypothetical protein
MNKDQWSPTYRFTKDFATSIKPGNPAFSKALLSD